MAIVAKAAAEVPAVANSGCFTRAIRPRVTGITDTMQTSTAEQTLALIAVL